MDMTEKYEMGGRCPACRTPYDKEKVAGMEANFERSIICFPVYFNCMLDTEF